MEQAEKQPMSKKNEALSQAISQIEKHYGKGAIMCLGGGTPVKIAGIPTGSLGLDIALGGRGVPRGRVVEVFGPEASGKTTLCLHIVASAQKMGGNAAFIDVEHALDSTYTQRIGVNLDSLVISQPDSGEQALETTELLVRSNAVDVIVIDSVAALVPKAELEGEMGDSHMGLQARLMSQALRKLTAAIGKSQTCVIFTNQIREKIGVFFGNPETTPGGRALKFYASTRIDVRRIGQIKEEEEVIGTRVRVQVVKNKVAPPFKKAEFDLMHKEGISYVGELIDLGITSGLVDKSGAWITYKEKQLGQGREKSKEFLKANPKIAESLAKEIKKAHGIEDAETPPPASKPVASSGKEETVKTGSAKSK